MSKKKTLSEAQVRRFQGLAGIPALRETTSPTEELSEIGSEMGGYMGDREEEKELSATEDELGAEDRLVDQEADELDAMDVEMDPSDEGGDLDLSPEQKEDLAADIVRAVAQELSAALDLDEPIEVETDGEEEMSMDMDMDMDMDMGDEEMEMELDVDEEPMMETGHKDTGASKGDESKTHRGEKDYTTKKGEKLKVGGKGRGEKPGDEAYVNEESTEEVDEALDEEALVNEVLRRVVKRLSKQQKQNNLLKLKRTVESSTVFCYNHNIKTIYIKLLGKLYYEC